MFLSKNTTLIDHTNLATSAQNKLPLLSKVQSIYLDDFSHLEKELKPLDLQACTEGGDTLLHFAVYEGNLKAVKLLIDRGADIEARNKGGYTPLLLAALSENVEILKHLVKKKADFSVKTAEGEGIYDLATRNKENAIEKTLVLIRAGMKEFMPGQNILFLAATKGELEVVKSILELNPNLLMVRNTRKETVLQHIRNYRRSGGDNFVTEGVFQFLMNTYKKLCQLGKLNTQETDEIYIILQQETRAAMSLQIQQLQLEQEILHRLNIISRNQDPETTDFEFQGDSVLSENLINALRQNRNITYLGVNYKDAIRDLIPIFEINRYITHIKLGLGCEVHSFKDEALPKLLKPRTNVSKLTIVGSEKMDEVLDTLLQKTQIQHICMDDGFWSPVVMNSSLYKSLCENQFLLRLEISIAHGLSEFLRAITKNAVLQSVHLNTSPYFFQHREASLTQLSKEIVEVVKQNKKLQELILALRYGPKLSNSQFDELMGALKETDTLNCFGYDLEAGPYEPLALLKKIHEMLSQNPMINKIRYVLQETVFSEHEVERVHQHFRDDIESPALVRVNMLLVLKDIKKQCLQNTQIQEMLRFARLASLEPFQFEKNLEEAFKWAERLYHKGQDRIYIILGDYLNRVLSNKGPAIKAYSQVILGNSHYDEAQYALGMLKLAMKPPENDAILSLTDPEVSYEIDLSDSPRSTDSSPYLKALPHFFQIQLANMQKHPLDRNKDHQQFEMKASKEVDTIVQQYLKSGKMDSSLPPQLQLKDIMPNSTTVISLLQTIKKQQEELEKLKSGMELDVPSTQGTVRKRDPQKDIEELERKAKRAKRE